MTPKVAVALLFLLAGCSGDSPPPPPPPPVPVALTMAAPVWEFQYSPGMPPSPIATSEGWKFAFPGVNGVHYLVEPVVGFLAGQLTATFRVELDPGAQLFEVQPCGGNNPAVRMYFERRGDNLSGVGAYEFYRWFSAPAPLDGSATALSAPVQFYK